MASTNDRMKTFLTNEIQCARGVLCVTISPDGQRLAAGLWGGDVLLLDARSGERRTRLNGTGGMTYGVAFSSAGASPPLLLAAGFADGTVRVWDCSSGVRVPVAELQGHSMSVTCVAFSPDGRLLASASLDKTVRLWRTDDWHAPPTVLSGHEGNVPGVSFSCDGRLLASCSKDRTVRLWHIVDSGAVADAAAGPVLVVGQPVFCVAFSPVDRMLLACGGDEAFLVLARVSAGNAAIAAERKLQGHFSVLSMAFSPCGRTLASASVDDTVRLWSVASGTCLRVLQRHTDRLKTVAFFPNGKQLASGSDDKTVRIWTLCVWSDTTHYLFGAPLKAAVFILMCVCAQLEQRQDGSHALQLPRLPMEVWLLIFGHLQLALEADAM